MESPNWITTPLTLDVFVEWFDTHVTPNMAGRGTGRFILRHADKHFLERARVLLGLNHLEVRPIQGRATWALYVCAKRDLLTLVAVVRPFTQSKGAMLDYVETRCKTVAGRRQTRRNNPGPKQSTRKPGRSVGSVSKIGRGIYPIEGVPRERPEWADLSRDSRGAAKAAAKAGVQERRAAVAQSPIEERDYAGYERAMRAIQERRSH